MMPADWIVPDWPAPLSVKCLTTTRQGGISGGPYASFNLGLNSGDDAGAIAANRQQLRALLPQEPKWLRQVHGASVVLADGLNDMPPADGSVAFEADTVCVVMMADCLPILFCSTDSRVVGAAHAGWRGLAAGVIENTVHTMQTPGTDLMAWLGPAIGPKVFEVGDEVREAFVAADPDASYGFTPHGELQTAQKWLADLVWLARMRLQRCGITRIYGGNWCTYSDPARFYSHRRDRVTGRMAALIWRQAA